MKTKKSLSIQEIDDGSSISFDEFLADEFGRPGTDERKKNDAKIEAAEMMMVLKEIRKQNKIKLKTVANILGVDESVVSKLESSNKDIQLGTLTRYVESMKGHLQLSFTIGTKKQIFDLV